MGGLWIGIGGVRGVRSPVISISIRQLFFFFFEDEKKSRRT